MSLSHNDRLIDAMRQAFEDEQRDIWAEIDEKRFLSVMDKKPELIDREKFLNERIDMPPFIVEPFFPSGGLCLLHGKRGLGKTFLAMSLMRSIVMGEDFLGRFPCRQGKVVYVQLDMTDYIFQERLMKAPHYYDVGEWSVLTGVASIQRGRVNDSWVQDVVAQQPDLIIIDTLRKAHTMSENDSDSAGRFYSKLRELFGYTAVLLVHHERKDSADNFNSSPAEMFRGSGAWLDDVDAGIRLHERSKRPWMTFSKTRTCPDLDPIPLEFDEHDMCFKSSDVGDFTRARPQVKKGSDGISMADAMRQELAELERNLPPNPGVVGSFREEATSHLRSKGYPKSRVSKAITEFMDKRS